MPNAFYKKARRIAKLSSEFQKEKSEFDELFEERYGVHYSDIDEDWLIDCFDYGQGGLPSLKRMDEMMTVSGFPPLKSNGD